MQATLEQSKLQYFEQLIIYSEIKELLFDHKTKQSGKTPIKAEPTVCITVLHLTHSLWNS